MGLYNGLFKNNGRMSNNEQGVLAKTPGERIKIQIERYIPHLNLLIADALHYGITAEATQSEDGTISITFKTKKDEQIN